LPHIDWPHQTARIRAACAQHGIPLPARVATLIDLRQPPTLAPGPARAFLRCFYAVRDLERRVRDAAGGGEATESFATRARERRATEVDVRLLALEQLLIKQAPPA
jgi:hypothetical protein